MPKTKKESDGKAVLQKNLIKTLSIILVAFGVLMLIAVVKTGKWFELSSVAVLVISGLLYQKDYKKWYNYMMIAFSGLQIIDIFNVRAKIGAELPIPVLVTDVLILILATSLIFVDKKDNN